MDDSNSNKRPSRRTDKILSKYAQESRRDDTIEGIKTFSWSKDNVAVEEGTEPYLPSLSTIPPGVTQGMRQGGAIRMKRLQVRGFVRARAWMNTAVTGFIPPGACQVRILLINDRFSNGKLPNIEDILQIPAGGAGHFPFLSFANISNSSRFEVLASRMMDLQKRNYSINTSLTSDQHWTSGMEDIFDFDIDMKDTIVRYDERSPSMGHEQVLTNNVLLYIIPCEQEAYAAVQWRVHYYDVK